MRFIGENANNSDNVIDWMIKHVYLSCGVYFQLWLKNKIEQNINSDNLNSDFKQVISVKVLTLELRFKGKV